VHAVADQHVTAVRKTCGVLFKSLHLEPFQRSTNDFPNVAPTAMHAFADTHDTPFREFATLGRRPRDAARWTDQLEPFHRSTNGMFRPFGPVIDPTTKHNLRAGHETPLSDTRALDGMAIRWTDHCRPFQRSANGVLIKREPDPIAVVTAPVAVHAVTDEHDTELRPPWAPPGRRKSLQPALVKRSASGPSGPPPTAMQDLTDGHETSDS
jgi:hypothetical protein